MEHAQHAAFFSFLATHRSCRFRTCGLFSYPIACGARPTTSVTGTPHVRAEMRAARIYSFCKDKGTNKLADRKKQPSPWRLSCYGHARVAPST